MVFFEKLAEARRLKSLAVALLEVSYFDVLVGGSFGGCGGPGGQSAGGGSGYKTASLHADCYTTTRPVALPHSHPARAGAVQSSALREGNTMRRSLTRPAALACAFVLGFAAAHLADIEGAAPGGGGAGPAYVIVSAKVHAPDKLGPYLEAAIPLAEKAGLDVLAAGNSGSSVHVLEGEWPYQGRLVVEKFASMDALLSFWNSPAYQAAKKLRKGHVETHFVIAVEPEEAAEE